VDAGLFLSEELDWLDVEFEPQPTKANKQTAKMLIRTVFNFIELPPKF
jgi:hypothetical protein